MKKFAVIGSPVEHSLSPLLHNWIFKTLKIQAEYGKIRVAEKDLPEIIHKINNGNLDGINVTVPHKENIMHFLDEINSRAECIGSVNCIMKSNSKIIGNNTDWFGFSQALQKSEIDINEREVVVFGAGGTSKSIIFSLKQLGVKRIILLNRTFQKAKDLQDDIVIPYTLDETENIIKQDSIIINATSVGMQTNQTLFDLRLINKNQILIDVIYIPQETSFIKLGNKIGAKTLNGLDMFIYQGLASLDLWFGDSVSKQVNFTHIKSYLKTHLC